MGHNRTRLMPSPRASSTICGLVARLTWARLCTSRSSTSSGRSTHPSDRRRSTFGSVWNDASSGSPRRLAWIAPQVPNSTGFTTCTTSGAKPSISLASLADGSATLCSGYHGKGIPLAATTRVPPSPSGAPGGARTRTS